jgi:hypothetical protein
MKLQAKKNIAAAKKEKDAQNKQDFLLCQAAHDKHGKRMLTCPCNEAAMEDIEIAPVRVANGTTGPFVPTPPAVSS